MSNVNDDEKSWIELTLEDMIKHTPETGYNLVGIDDFNMPGDILYLIDNFDTYEEALKAQKEYRGQNTVIYGPDAETVLAVKKELEKYRNKRSKEIKKTT